ncbi:hypothetical protein ACWDFH_21195 [Streptomyces kronopolitis]
MKTRPAVLLVTVAALLAGCHASYPAGPAGTVTGRHAIYRRADGWHYSLATTGAAFRVTRQDWRRCVRGSHYPTCTAHERTPR